MYRRILGLLLWLGLTALLPAENLHLATWNVEHLGSPGRGLGYRPLELRTREQLAGIASLIKEEEIALLALQEVAVSRREGELYRSDALDSLCALLGGQWNYVIAPPGGEMPGSEDVHNMQNAWLWDGEKALLEKSFALPVENVEVGGKSTFDRRPWAAWFSFYRRGEIGNDLLLVNLHMASGQDNDENHLAAMVMVERSINGALRSLDITESDRIILGDFNDNPWARDDRGRLKYSSLLYQYMEEKSYQDLVKESMGFTRINRDMNSIIDHVLVNSSARRHLASQNLKILRPEAETLEEYQRWREDYSDHFPLIFSVKITSDDDAD